jgi:hypothetical protein
VSNRLFALAYFQISGIALAHQPSDRATIFYVHAKHAQTANIVQYCLCSTCIQIVALLYFLYNNSIRQRLLRQNEPYQEFYTRFKVQKVHICYPATERKTQQKEELNWIRVNREGQIYPLKGKNKGISGLKNWVFSLQCWRLLLEEM